MVRLGSCDVGHQTAEQLIDFKLTHHSGRLKARDVASHVHIEYVSLCPEAMRLSERSLVLGPHWQVRKAVARLMCPEVSGHKQAR